MFSRSLCTMPKHGRSRRRKKRRSRRVSGNGTESTACCVERQSDECRNKAENKHEGQRGSGSQPQVAMGRQWTSEDWHTHAASILGVSVGRGRNGKPKTPWQTRPREKQEDIGQEQLKPGANGVDTHNELTNNAVHSADISRKWLLRCIYRRKYQPTRPKSKYNTCCRLYDDIASNSSPSEKTFDPCPASPGGR